MLLTILKKNPVVPVAVFQNAGDARKVAEILLDENITVLEITLRTDAAFDCIAAIASGFPGITVGAGSVLSTEALLRARDSGALFAVAPCCDEEVVDRAAALGIPFIPGISTPTELSRAIKKSKVIKFFPASAMGGVDFIKAITPPFRSMDFHLMPTGGVNEKNYLEYLAADRVISCGMTYPVESALLDKGDFTSVRERVRRIVSGIPAR